LVEFIELLANRWITRQAAGDRLQLGRHIAIALGVARRVGQLRELLLEVLQLSLLGLYKRWIRCGILLEPSQQLFGGTDSLAQHRDLALTLFGRCHKPPHQ
jgi:hypothetical protein